MAVGSGRYDEICKAVREETGAFGAILMIMDGDQGDGFSVQVPHELLGLVPALLRQTADAIEAEVKADAREIQILMRKDQ
jgi:hypothetical protein